MDDVGRAAPAAQAPAQIPVPTVFHEPWWLEAASDGAYDEATVSSGGQVVGRLPYFLSSKCGQRTVTMPPMTHLLGPALVPGMRPLRQFTLTCDLIAQLPGAPHTRFHLHRGVADTLAFEAAGFTTEVDFTSEIAPAPPEALWRQMRDKTRNSIRRAEERLAVEDLPDPRRFLDFYAENLDERGLRNAYPRASSTRLIEECLLRRAGRLLGAVDPSGTLQAGIFTVWDAEVEYYFMSSRLRTSHNGAVSLLLWTAIRHASQNGLVFDADDVNPKNLLLVSGFGGTVRPRYIVHRTSAAFRVAQYAKRWLRARSGWPGFLGPRAAGRVTGGAE